MSAPTLPVEPGTEVRSEHAPVSIDGGPLSAGSSIIPAANMDIGEFDASTVAVVRSEIEAQIAAARQYPRSLAVFKRDLYTMATMSREVADSCYYSLPRREGGKKKFLEGPSVRFAEMVAASYRNIRRDGRPIEIGQRFVKAQGLCWDMEQNNGARIEVIRRITDKHGKRYGDDMIGVTMNAAIAIAVRNAVFDVIPFVLCQEAYEAALSVATKKTESMEVRVARLFEEWSEQGAKPEHVLAIVGREGSADITAKDIRSLRGVLNAVKSGETTLDRLLRPELAEDRTDAFAASLKKKPKKAAKNAVAVLESLLSSLFPDGAPEAYQAVVKRADATEVALAVKTLTERLDHGGSDEGEGGGT